MHHHTVAYLFRKLVLNIQCKLTESWWLGVYISLKKFIIIYNGTFLSTVIKYSFRNGRFGAKKREKIRFTFSQSVFTWVSLSCLHSISCSIHDSKSFAVALSSTIVIVEVLRVSKITPLFIFLRKSDRNMYKSTRFSIFRLLPSKFNVRKTLWRSTNLDTDEAHA